MDRPPALETARLVLRPLTKADIPALVVELNDFEVSKWLTVVPYPYRAADAAMIAPMQYSQIIWGAAFGYFVFAEVPDRYTWIGASVISGDFDRDALKRTLYAA